MLTYRLATKQYRHYIAERTLEEYRELTWLIERTIHKYTQFEKKPQRYCRDLMLTQPEIHTIALIGDQEGINLTKLAGLRGITKGAASQMIYKLVDKDLVKKKISPNSDSEINLFLTKKGKKAREEHRRRHEAMGERFEELLKDIPKDVQQKMRDFLLSFEKELDGYV